jgi:DUF3040 family protein
MLTKHEKRQLREIEQWLEREDAALARKLCARPTRSALRAEWLIIVPLILGLLAVAAGMWWHDLMLAALAAMFAWIAPLVVSFQLSAHR